MCLLMNPEEFAAISHTAYYMSRKLYYGIFSYRASPKNGFAAPFQPNRAMFFGKRCQNYVFRLRNLISSIQKPDFHVMSGKV